ncbi:MAG: hypothetical protein J3Q66DRAFT_368259 [Benniella sp.]|nr:MAG: hypothetical protein J3Q66DRAFT_368259 [Benniella sp.]
MTVACTYLFFLSRTDPEIPDASHIGSGNKSHTQVVRTEVVTTNLPACRLYGSNNNLELDLRRFLTERSERDFKKLLICDEDLELRPDEIPGSTTVQFRIFDMPGLDDTNGEDIKNIARTFSALTETKEFHLILIMDSHAVPLLPTQEDAYKAYFELLEELRDLVTIVHTKVADKHQHPENTDLEERLLKRSEFFDNVVGREVETKMINCDLKETGPVHRCLTWNTIREILELATNGTPVFIHRTYVHKALIMVPVDRKVLQMCKNKLALLTQSSNLQKLIVDMVKTRVKIKEKRQLIRKHDTDKLLTIYERRYEEEWSLIHWPKEITMEMQEQELDIDEIVLNEQSTYLTHQAGGVGNKSWEVRFKRRFFHKGHFDVALKDISQRLSADTLPLEKFMELAEAGIYQGSDVDRCADTLESYLEKKMGLDGTED